ncbi:AurF N-oxygenase family protein [Streptomyces specialis]|uniref:AurF N-oxygenase family protein n=1 Tax=Streptomyces specialis TaxID=498367 RepID=UPI00073E55FF|nr:diiron oxygenase [Streptomyces specialis]
MSDTVTETRSTEDVSRRLLESAAKLSYDPAVEVDWDAPLAPGLHGLNPEWSTLYGTALWDRMSEEQRVTLTRHEVASIMSTGIWFEMILQQMVLREQYGKNPGTSEFQFALTEVADECRHSIMFARACQKMGIAAYSPKRSVLELGRLFKSLAVAEVAYASILVAEEVLDLMQRDAMRGENVLPLVRTTSRIHVVEESRHMRFARAEVRDRLRDAGPARRATSAVSVALVAYFIVTSMVNEDVYTAAGLDAREAVKAARGNEHHAAMMRSGAANLVKFLGEVGLLTRPAMSVYRRINLI